MKTDMKEDGMCKTSRQYAGFTIVELTVVVTIIAILGTIGFISMTGYLAGSRDTTRLADMNSIYTALGMTNGNNGAYPLPENYRTIALSGTIMSYQGYAGKSVLSAIKFEKGGKDPKDNTYYTYTTNKKQSQAQLLGYFEDYDTSKLANAPALLIDSAHAATSLNYLDRKIGIIGKDVCMLLETGSLLPVQTTSTGTIDIGSTPNSYTLYCDSTTSVKGTGAVLSPAFVANSVAYSSASAVTVSPTWTVAGGGDCSGVDNTQGANGDTSTCTDSRLYTHSGGTGLSFTGKTYNILKIPSDTVPTGIWWFNQNLAYPLADSSKYRGSNTWSGGDAGLYSCPGNNGTTTTDCTLVPTLGYLYQWNAIMSGALSNNNPVARTQGICPSGWGIPTKVDFTTSNNGYWPNSSNDNTYTYTGSTTGWVSSFVGYRNPNITGLFFSRTTDELIWSSNVSWIEAFSSNHPLQSYRNIDIVASGFSVRCLKN